MVATIKKEFSIEEPLDKVWANISNPNEIVSCVPGAELTETIDETHYKGQVSLKFGPVKTQYAGQIEITEMDHTLHKMGLNGKGLDSKGKGSAEMNMTGVVIEEDGKVNVTFQMEITIVGMLAQFGSRLINDVSDQMLDQFIGNFKAKLAGQEYDNSLKAGSVVGSIIKGVFKKSNN
jgi:carbon monoxide dehydrogenase subunit G